MKKPQAIRGVRCLALAAGMLLLSASGATAQNDTWESVSAAAAKNVDSGQLKEGVELWESAVKMAKNFGESDPRYAASLAGHGNALLRLGKYTDADKELKEALKVRKETAGENSAEVVVALQDLARLYFLWSRHKSTMASTELAQEKVTSPYASGGQPGSIPTTRNVDVPATGRGPSGGPSAWARDHLVAARKYLESALEIRTKFSSPDSREIKDLHRQLIILENYSGQVRKSVIGDTWDAADADEAIAEFPLKESRLWIIEDWYKSGKQLLAKGDLSGAESYFKGSVKIIEKTLGPDDERVAPNLLGLAETYLNQNRFAEAEAALRRALPIAETKWGTTHRLTGTILKDLASALEGQKRAAEAEPLRKRADAILTAPK
jgi:tetratricopeptide (TPR) repeat protein